MMKNPLNLKRIIGEQLSSIEFVQDYFQLRFDGPTITVISTKTTIKAGGVESTSWDEKFRNMVCGQIRKIVKDVALKENQDLRISFEDKSEIIVSLRPEDQRTPEAINLNGFTEGQSGVL